MRTVLVLALLLLCCGVASAWPYYPPGSGYYCGPYGCYPLPYAYPYYGPRLGVDLNFRRGWDWDRDDWRWRQREREHDRWDRRWDRWDRDYWRR